MLGRGWRERVRDSPLITELARSQARISRARTACAMVGAEPEVSSLLERAADAERKLAEEVDQALAWSALPAEGSLHQKLSRLAAAAKPLALDADEHVLFEVPVEDGKVTVTTKREYCETRTVVLPLRACSALKLPKQPAIDLAIRLRGALQVAGPPRGQPGVHAVVEATRYDGFQSTPGHVLAWPGGLLFLPYRKTGDLLTALLRPATHEPADASSDVEVLNVLAALLPWVEGEVVDRLEQSGLPWLLPRRDLVDMVGLLHHRSFKLPAYRLGVGGEKAIRVLSSTDAT